MGAVSHVPLIVGNWKMHLNHLEAVRLVQDLWQKISSNSDVEVVVCPPFTALRSVATVIEADRMHIGLGAQNVHFEKQGAFTGEVSPPMLKSLGVSYVIVGHSERRGYFGESDLIVNRKVKAVHDEGMTSIMCVGESLETRRAGRAVAFVKDQVKNCLEGLPEQIVGNMVIAYEPIWAIGTGVNATPQDANEMIGEIRRVLASLYSPDVAMKVRILYGGSVKRSNIKELMAEKEVDGVLVGGASIDADEFADIVNYREL